MSVNIMQLYSRSMSVNSLLDSRGPPLVMPDEPMKPRVRPDGKPYYEKDKGGSDIASVFQWNIQDDILLPLDTAQRRKIKQKNFVTLNKDEVKRIEEKVKDAQKKVREELKAELAKPLWKSDKYNGVGSKVTKEAALQPTPVNGHGSAVVEHPIAVVAGRQSRHQTPVKSNHANKIPNGTLPNGIAAPEPLTPRSKSVEPFHMHSHPGNAHPGQPKAGKNSAHKHNFVQANAQAVSRASIKRAPSATALDDMKKKMDAALKHHPHGQVPGYLKERKKALKIANEPPKSPDVPPGHVLMNAEEKMRTLGSLKRAEADLLKRYNTLPVRTDTEFLQRKKQALMRRLGEVDEAIKIFSRPKVYIKTDPY